MLETYGSGQAMPLRAWVDQLHRNLHLGDAGRLYTELAASWLWVLVLAGLTLWIGLVRRRRKERASALLVPRTSGGRRARLLSWHAVVGLWAAAGLLFLSATGLTWWPTYAGENISTLRAQLSWETPEPGTALPGTVTVAPEAGEHAGHGGMAMPTPTTATPASFDVAARAAADAGLDGPLDITPGGEGAATTVSQIDRTWPQRLDAIAVDPDTGQVTDVVRGDRLAARRQARPLGHRCAHGTAVRGGEPGRARGPRHRTRLHDRVGLRPLVAPRTGQRPGHVPADGRSCGPCRGGSTPRWSW